MEYRNTTTHSLVMSFISNFLRYITHNTQQHNEATSSATILVVFVILFQLQLLLQPQPHLISFSIRVILNHLKEYSSFFSISNPHILIKILIRMFSIHILILMATILIIINDTALVYSNVMCCFFFNVKVGVSPYDKNIH